MYWCLTRTGLYMSVEYCVTCMNLLFSNSRVQSYIKRGRLLDLRLYKGALLAHRKRNNSRCWFSSMLTLLVGMLLFRRDLKNHLRCWFEQSPACQPC